MAVHLLRLDDLYFPPVEDADAEGLIAVGGALSPDWLLLAYESGIFPWFSEGDPILWWSPDPRFVLRPSEVKVSKSMRTILRRPKWSFSLDRAFDRVVAHCADMPRRGQDGTWITKEMRAAYSKLHQMGMAHSAEAWCAGRLIGGLYGVSVGGVFFGESMFSLEPNASKYAFIQLCRWLEARQFTLIDCQIPSDHLRRLGAYELTRTLFLDRLEWALEKPTLKGPWQTDNFSVSG